jgi:release factor glutamine methyltransferase
LIDRDVTVSQDASSTPPAADAWTVKRVLEWTTQHLARHGSESARLEAEILLAHARQCRRIQLYTQYDEVLTDAVRGHMRDLVQRRAKREPVAYLVGYREFFSLEFKVTPDVLIPRPDTETLVMEAIAVAKPMATPTILDLCTGSGCIAVALAKQLPKARLTAVDLSPSALTIAQENAVKHAVADRLECLTGDLFATLPAGKTFDVIATNPPYVTTLELKTLDEDVRKYEPRLALDGGPDGLDIIRKIVATAPDYLAHPGWLFIELAPEQAIPVQQLAESTGHYEAVSVIKDLSGTPRVVKARRR